MSRSHDCKSDVPLKTTYTKRPSTSECLEPECYWQRYAVDTSPAALADLRMLALHHAKSRIHRVAVRLAQDVVLEPIGQPTASGAMAVTGR